MSLQSHVSTRSMHIGRTLEVKTLGILTADMLCDMHNPAQATAFIYLERKTNERISVEVSVTFINIYSIYYLNIQQD